MAVINFTVPKILERRVEQTIRQKGFASKAEFFRTAAIQFLDALNKPALDENDRFQCLTDKLNEEIEKTYRDKKIASAQEQLNDL